MFHSPLIRGFVIAVIGVLLMTMLFPITALAHQSASSIKLVGSLSVNPSSGPPGTVVTVTGSGWKPGGTIEIRLFSFSAGDVAQAQIASDGTFSTTFTIPSDAPVGQLSIFGDEAGGPSTTTFTVTPSHPQAPTGHPIKICAFGADPALTGCILPPNLNLGNGEEPPSGQLKTGHGCTHHCGKSKTSGKSKKLKKRPIPFPVPTPKPPPVPKGLFDCKSNVTMYTRVDKGVPLHNEYVGVNVPTDVSNLYNGGHAFITYSNGNDHESFNNHTWMRTRGDKGINLWGVSGFWILLGHLNWRHGKWVAHYRCSGSV
jgi:hypothetical protein